MSDIWAWSSVAGNLTCTEPTGTVEGDLLIAICLHAASATAWTGPSGWTEIGQTSAAGNSASAWYIVRGASAPDLTWGGPGASNSRITVITINAYDSSNIVDSFNSGTSVGTATPTCPSGTSAVKDSIFLTGIACQSGVATVSADPASYANLVGSGTRRVDWVKKATAGTISGETWTITSSFSQTAMVTVVIGAKDTPPGLGPKPGMNVSMFSN